MPPSERTTFEERLAFARLVYHFRTGKTPGNAAIARSAGRTGEWLTKWERSAEPPTDFRVHTPIAAFLAGDNSNAEALERWLFREIGDPPMPELWKEWLAKRRRAPVTQIPASSFRPATKAAGAGAKRRRKHP